MIGESEMSISGGYLHIPVRVYEQFLDDGRAEAQCIPIGEYLRICIDNEPYDLVLDVPLLEWHVGELKTRKMYDYSVYINRWHELLDTYEREERTFIDVKMRVGSVEPIDVSLMRKDTDKGITFQQAEQIVDDYLNKNGGAWSRIKTSDVVSSMEVEGTSHNLKRIHDALDERCDVIDQGKYGTKVFESPITETP